MAERANKFIFVQGTRPEIVKMWSLIKYCEENKIQFKIIHTGQHYSKNMSSDFFEEFNLPQPDYNLDINGMDHLSKLGFMIQALKPILIEEKPTHVIVQGDTISVLAGAIAAKFLKIKVVHIEAGLRCGEWIPEEISRAMTDSIADYHFLPTENQRRNILDKDNSFIVGNTISDIVQHYAKEDSLFYKKLKLSPKEYFVLTCHREENLTKEKLGELMKICLEVYVRYKVPIIFPIHPNTSNKIKEFKINLSSGLKTIDPTNYKDMVSLIKNAKAILTDSGGIQEEACILKVPCITLRDSTERPETVDVGGNICTGLDLAEVIHSLEILLKKKKIEWYNPFGEDVAKKIMETLEGLFKEIQGGLYKPPSIIEYKNELYGEQCHLT